MVPKGPKVVALIDSLKWVSAQLLCHEYQVHLNYPLPPRCSLGCHKLNRLMGNPICDLPVTVHKTTSPPSPPVRVQLTHPRIGSSRNTSPALSNIYSMCQRYTAHNVTLCESTALRYINGFAAKLSHHY